jgi:hypothetical protein
VPRPARGVGQVLFVWPLAGLGEQAWYDALFVCWGSDMFCKDCGSAIPDYSDRCIFCGANARRKIVISNAIVCWGYILAGAFPAIGAFLGAGPPAIALTGLSLFFGLIIAAIIAIFCVFCGKPSHGIGLVVLGGISFVFWIAVWFAMSDHWRQNW